MKKIEADNQEIKMAEERIAKLSKTMQNSKEKTSKLLNQESYLFEKIWLIRSPRIWWLINLTLNAYDGLNVCYESYVRQISWDPNHFGTCWALDQKSTRENLKRQPFSNCQNASSAAKIWHCQAMIINFFSKVRYFLRKILAPL